jgi:nitrous-oxide reductase
VPILDFKESIRGQCEIGLGPLHTVFDDKGFAYTSVFIETVVAKWSLKDLKVVEKIDTHFNIGHLVAAEGDTVSPDGKYLIAMNKWALDRFSPVGPAAAAELPADRHRRCRRCSCSTTCRCRSGSRTTRR